MRNELILVLVEKIKDDDYRILRLKFHEIKRNLKEVASNN